MSTSCLYLQLIFVMRLKLYILQVAVMPFVFQYYLYQILHFIHGIMLH